MIHLDKENNLHLIYDEDDMTYQCPIISEKIQLNDEFIETNLKMWKRLAEDKLIFDLIKMDSEKREKSGINYEIVI